MHKKSLGAVALSAGLAFGLAAAPAQGAVACDTPAKDAVYKTVVTPATADVFKSVKVVDVVAVPGKPGTPAVYEDVKVIDVAYQPPTPGTPPVEEVSHIEHRLVTPGVPEVKEVSHQEYKYKKSVADYKTQYHFAKYTETRQGKKDKYGNIVWGAFSAWTKWSPETHTSWQDNNNPLGSPAPHASWTTGSGSNKVYFERLWQARFDGQTRQVANGSHTEYYKNGDWTTDTPGAPWVKYDERKFVDVEFKPAVPPVYEDVKVIDVAYKPGTPGTPEVKEVSHIEHRLVTPATPDTPAVEEDGKYPKVSDR